MVRCKSRFRSQGKEEYHCDTKFNSLKTLHFIFSVNQIAIELNAPCNTPRQRNLCGTFSWNGKNCMKGFASS